MEDYSLVEADFQEHYHINLGEHCKDSTGFLRYARLFSELPTTSRCKLAMNPANGWQWNDEVQSRILFYLGSINSILFNTNRKKGQKAVQADEQFQPTYVKQAKQDLEDAKKRKEADIKQAKDFWQARNPKVKMS